MTLGKVSAGSGLVDDLASLTTLDESSLLEEIKVRYSRDILYTYIGDILVAVNPYKRILIYGPDFEEKYRNLKMRRMLPPHLFAVSDQAYQSLRRTGWNQCCVVSGESGAGKTESTKLIVQHITHLCQQKTTGIHQRIVQVNPLLEAFGNAQTQMNNNSSRFGKYIEMIFSHEGALLGAQLAEYLLEKSRVVSQGVGERNFHIFYYMFAGLHPEQLSVNLLDRPENHRILRPVDGSAIYTSENEFRFHQEMWQQLRTIMDCVGFTSDEVNMILAMLAAILHITDITFDNDYETDGVYIVHEEMLELAAELLAIVPEELAAALICNVTILRGEKIVSLKSIDQANDGRDALAKSLYGRLFGWMVRQINFMLQPDRRQFAAGATIGILDIAGFEDFKTNSFEQLCINVANEQLQFYFNQHIFSWEQEEYKKEGIKAKDVKFTDNRPTLDLMLEGPLSVFSLIDEESRFPQATDGSLVEKLNKNLAKKSSYQRAKGSTLTFTINHYAGPVVYTSTGFLEKNRDTLSTNLMECMKNSESQTVCDLFTAPISDTGSLQMNPNAPQRSRQSVLLCKPKDLSYTKTRSLSKSAGKRLKSQAKPQPLYENSTQQTLGHNFKNSLTDLMAKLLDAQPHFVRCIKPNTVKKTSLFESAVVKKQLQYTGIMETVRIRRLGFPTRIPHRIFIDRYQMIAFPITAKIDTTTSNCSKILKKSGLSNDWQVGKTKVFLKYWHQEQLNGIMDKLGWSIVYSQKYVRGFLARKKYRGMVELSRQDQAALRGFCVYIVNTTDDKFYTISRQQEHDAQRFAKGGIERGRRGAALSPTRQPRLRSPSPRSRNPNQNSVYSTGLSQAASHGRSYSPADSNAGGRRQQREQIYQPTPFTMLQTGGATANKAGPAPGARPGLRRHNSREDKDKEYGYAPGSALSQNPAYAYQYPTDSMIAPSKKQPNFDVNERSHYARPQAVGAPAANRFQDNQSDYGSATSLTRGAQFANQRPTTVFYNRLLEDIVPKLQMGELESAWWGKIYYLEKAEDVAKLYVKEKQLIIDNSKQEYDGYVIGLGAFSNAHRDAACEKIRSSIGKGVQLSVDEEGSIFAKKQTPADIIVKGYKEPQTHCISVEVIEHLGRLTDKPMKIFDMKEFRSHIALELRKPSIDAQRLYHLCVVSFSFVRNTFDDLDTPCWISIVNLIALRAIGSEMLFQEVKNLAQLNISGVEEAQLKRTWASIRLGEADIESPYGIYGMHAAPNTGVQRQSRADQQPGNGIIQQVQRPGASGRSASPGYADSIMYDRDSAYSSNSDQTLISKGGEYDTAEMAALGTKKRNWAKLRNKKEANVLY